MEEAMISLFHSAAKQMALATQLMDTLKAIFISILLNFFILISHIFSRQTADYTIRDSRGDIAAAMSKEEEAKMSVFEVREAMGKLCGDELESCDDELLEELGMVISEEVREAFDIFDENKDGFIDANEVKRVLGGLGIMEASEIQCNGMIKAFDNDGDGKINFIEFTKIIEDGFR